MGKLHGRGPIAGRLERAERVQPLKIGSRRCLTPPSPATTGEEMGNITGSDVVPQIDNSSTLETKLELSWITPSLYGVGTPIPRGDH